MTEIPWAEIIISTIVAVLATLGAVTVWTHSDPADSCGLMCQCWAEPGNKYLTCGVRE